MEFYTYQFFINQSSNTNLMKYLVFISLLALLLIIILKKFHSRDKMKYRDLIILVSLGIIFMVGIQINEYEVGKTNRNNSSRMINFLENISDNQQVPAGNLSVNSKYVKDEMLVKIGEDYSIEFDAGLNTSHEDRKKMSIINALLSLNQEAIGTFYPFISDAPTSSFDFDTTHKYLLGIKDIFGQSIIMTKDVDINSDNYQDLSTQKNVSQIFLLESKLYCEGDNEPELHEVSTLVTSLRNII